MKTHRRGADSGAPPVGLSTLAFAAPLIVGLTLLAGCGSGGSAHVKGTNVVQATQSQNGSTVQQSNSGSGNVTNESTTSSGSLSQSSFSAKGQTIRTIGGSDGATISLTVESSSRLLWSNTLGRPFAVHDEAGGLSIDSSSGSGEASLPAGKHKLSISGDVWTVVIRPS